MEFAGYIDRHYAIAPTVRARQEAFGLLFYDTTNSRLTFVRCGNLLQIVMDPRGKKHVIASPEAASLSGIKKLLNDLHKKGLIGEP